MQFTIKLETSFCLAKGFSLAISSDLIPVNIAIPSLPPDHLATGEGATHQTVALSVNISFCHQLIFLFGFPNFFFVSLPPDHPAAGGGATRCLNHVVAPSVNIFL